MRVSAVAKAMEDKSTYRCIGDEELQIGIAGLEGRCKQRPHTTLVQSEGPFQSGG
jgi:hypothetical protein